MGLLVSSYALLYYERHEKSSSVELCCLLGLICPEDGLRRFLHGGRDATRSQGTELAKIWCFGLRGCFWGGAHAGEWSAELYSAGGELANLPEALS